jgi:hypothetical protein
MQRPAGRNRDVAEISLREMVAHLNVIEASIDALEKGSGETLGSRAHDVLNRLELLAMSAARLHIADVTRVTDALEELVLAVHLRRPKTAHDVAATLRHGVDVLMLLTHDKMRRLQGYPGAELRPAADALLDRVDRLMADCAALRPIGLKLAGL